MNKFWLSVNWYTQRADNLNGQQVDVLAYDRALSLTGEMVCRDGWIQEHAEPTAQVWDLDQKMPLQARVSAPKQPNTGRHTHAVGNRCAGSSQLPTLHQEKQ